MSSFILICMLFCHIIDDFVLQGILAKMKQKNWWKTLDSYSDFYENDYIIALFAHSFEWTFMIMLPLAFAVGFELPVWMVVAYIINTSIHCIIDDLKANKLKINLVTDQLLHIIQIIITFSFYAGGIL